MQESDAIDRLAMKLSAGCELTEADRAVLARLSTRTRRVAAHIDLIAEGDIPDEAHLITAGIACRYKVVPGGERQITALLLPGDFCDPHGGVRSKMDHSVGTLTECTLADIPRRTMDELVGAHPRIARAFRWATLVDESILRQWLVGMGRRPAHAQLAHLCCELHLRLMVVDLADERGCDLPLTQAQIGDILGLSVVHVSRSFVKLRNMGLVVLRSKRLNIHNQVELARLSGFDPNYLHLRI